MSVVLERTMFPRNISRKAPSSSPSPEEAAGDEDSPRAVEEDAYPEPAAGDEDSPAAVEDAYLEPMAADAAEDSDAEEIQLREALLASRRAAGLVYSRSANKSYAQDFTGMISF